MDLLEKLENAEFDTENSELQFASRFEGLDDCVIGVTCDDRLVYSYEKMAEHYMKESNCDYAEACDNIDYGTVRFYNQFEVKFPVWLKPYNVLSNGEKMRVDLARALLEKDFVVFDEFTSVVDRQVAKVACIAVNKAVKKTNKKFIAVSCHKDIIEWLQPDWIFDTDTMKQVFQLAHDPNKSLKLGVVGENNGENLGVITI